MRRVLFAIGLAVLVVLLGSASGRSSLAAGETMHIQGTLCVDLSCGEEAYGLEVTVTIGDNDSPCANATTTSHAFTDEGDFLTVAGFEMDIPSANDVPGCGVIFQPLHFKAGSRAENVSAEVQWYPGVDYVVSVSVGDSEVLNGYLSFGDEGFQFPCTAPCNGPLLKAFAGAQKCGELQSMGTDARSYYRNFIIAGADLKPGCAQDGDTVTVTIDGAPAHEQLEFRPGFIGQQLSTGPRSARFSGHACVDSNCSQSKLGLPVVAKIGGVVCGETETDYPISDGIEQSLYTILVAPIEKTPGCGTEGATIDFYINGRKTRQTATWTDGGFTSLALWTGPDFAAYSGYTTCNGKPCYNCFSPCATATIQAYIGDEMCGDDTPYGWLIGNGYGPMIVLSNEQRAGCGTPGATVHFKINNLDVAETATWTPGFSWQPLTAGDVLWGDTNCSRSLDAADALRIIADNAGTPVPTNCFNLRQILHLSPFNVDANWGDFDCSGGDPTLIDAVKLLAAAASGEPPQESGCPPPAAVIQGYPVFAS
jgi:hypothetical protein